MSCEEPTSKRMKMELTTETVPSGKVQETEPTKEEPSENPMLKDQNGDAYFEISSKRRCTVRSFKGNTLIDIREMYEKDGKMLPGKKGISLTMGQFETLRDLIKAGHIDDAISKM